MIELLKSEQYPQVANFVNNYIKDFEESDAKRRMFVGEKYYKNENIEILNRKKQIYATKKNHQNKDVSFLIDDPYHANNTLPSGFAKIIIDQKVGYSVNEEMKLPDNLDVKGLKQTTKDAATESSQKIYGVVQTYIDNDQNFRTKLIPSEQIIPIQNAETGEYDIFIRYYTETVVDSSGKDVTLDTVEVWDDEYVYYFVRSDRRRKYEFDNKYHEENPKKHIDRVITQGGEVVEKEGQSWGRPPFAILFNNNIQRTDVDPIKMFIDGYDIVNSDFLNNLEDFQDVFWILKNYNGQDVNEFMRQLNEFKSIPIDGDGDARAETIEIPAEAREKYLDLARRNIYEFGMGVDMSDIKGDTTNLTIKAMFANLDIKANGFEVAVNLFIKQIAELYNRYIDLGGEGTKVDVEENVKFTRKVLINEIEILDANAGQMGVVSDDTRLSNHPWVENVEEEKEKIKMESEVINIPESEDE